MYVISFHASFVLSVGKTWQASDLCGVIVGRGVGRAFCAGGDVAGGYHWAHYTSRTLILSRSHPECKE